MNRIMIYADGACRGNGKKNNIGAYGVYLQYGAHEKELKQAYRNTSNQKMEIMACIAALKTLNRYDLPVLVHTDSAYVCNCINQRWYVKWLGNGWITSSKTPVENRELWIELINLIEKFKWITFVKVKGHSGVEGNEAADRLANEAMDELEAF